MINPEREALVNIFGDVYVVPFALSRRTEKITRNHPTDNISEISVEILELDDDYEIQNEDCLELINDYDYDHSDVSKIVTFMIINVIEDQPVF